MSQILGSQELIQGYSQEDLANQLAAQIISLPESLNPVVIDDDTDPRGKRGSQERYENFQVESLDGVAFLSGIFNFDAPAIRTIVGQDEVVYFAPFVNISLDNTTDDFSPGAGFPGGYALTQKHLADLIAEGLNPRDPSGLVGEVGGSLPTLQKVAQYLADFMDEQFVKIDGIDVTPENITLYRKDTDDTLSYAELPRSTGAIYTPLIYNSPEEIFVADPDQGSNLDNNDPTDDTFPTLAEVNPTLTEFVIPFVQDGYYFGLELNPEVNTVQFGGNSPLGAQDIIYNLLNPVNGTKQKDNLSGTPENDYVNGKQKKDKLFGNEGDDLLIGGKGKDYLDGGNGNDELWGDGGNDKFVYKFGYGQDKIFDFEPGDMIKFDGFNDAGVISSVILPSGVKAIEIKFNDNDLLTIIGVESDDMSINAKTSTIMYF
ncbi:MAG: hypothetical protein DSM107014_01095 [Gomphosphaeria aponina SAG 52.96 = DSM 107014]|uniref:Calcium-binding protein n=1 Tax=Gomphosphaeria aponina SAG 52.96 = DSM 107014 TaxID=1521640 RepID=A0A941JNP8_9CHRO|nr:hypothetical protein [Gomphosphaeria aponina SAG 52.96 = DSM 107014]